MFSYLIDGIPFEIPANSSEMQEIFLAMVEDSSERQVINFVNPEIFLEARRNPFLKAHLMNAKYNFIDGIGLLMLINQEMNTKYSVNDRYTGTDFFNYLEKCHKVRIYLYGASKENNEEAAKRISSKCNIQVVGHTDGYTQKQNLVSEINKIIPDILIVCLGCPRQEKWIDENIDLLKCKVVFGNGGAIDFWSGNVKRAPAFFLNHKLEWLFRLFQDFNLKRIKRQIKLISFVWNMKFHKFHVEEQL